MTALNCVGNYRSILLTEKLSRAIFCLHKNCFFVIFLSLGIFFQNIAESSPWRLRYWKTLILIVLLFPTNEQKVSNVIRPKKSVKKRAPDESVSSGEVS